ncbi:MAG: sugar transferase [Acidobacteria bacterium]|nr:sugar transferase [Acidobacteriota bacterium]
MRAVPGGQISNQQSAMSNRHGLPRGFDVIVSLMGLIILSPVLLASAVVVLLTSGGGALFRQQRVGRYGEIFTLYKLQTMVISEKGPQVTTSNDPRITRVGKFLRRTKLDELPTLWNVVRGDMSFVGPRPEVPRYVNLDDPLWQMILAVRPGITDPMTLSLRREEELLANAASDTEGDAEKYYVNVLQPQKLKGYAAYLSERSWKSDLKVLLQTVGAVIVPFDT